MKLLSVFRKTLREMLREPLILALSLAFAPFFVLLYYLFFPSGSTTFGILVLNQDSGAQLPGGAALHAGQDVINAMRQVSYPNGSPMLTVNLVTDRADAELRLRNRDAAALVILPADFSRTLQAVVAGQTGQTSSVTLVGDLTNPTYAVAAIMASTPLDAYVQAYTGIRSPIQLNEIALGASAARTEFENYVPGLLVFAVILLIFLAAMTVAREVEAGTLRRLQLTHMSSFDLLGGISLALILVGAVAVLLGFLTAQALGFRSQGPLWVAILVGMVTALSIIGAGLVVACFARSVSQAFVIANFPLALFMFFSSAIYPLPKVPLFSLAGHTVGLYDFLPPTHAVSALNKILTLGATWSDITYELGALCLLSLLYFGLGVWLFQRRHLRHA
jgi:ABC-2 type transport system permease protein